MPDDKPENGWERWRGGVDVTLKEICKDIKEVKQGQRDARIGAAQMGGVVGGVISGALLAFKWILTQLKGG